MKKKTPIWVKIIIVVFIILMYGSFFCMIFFDTWEVKLEKNNNGSISIDRGKLTIQKETDGYYDEETDSFYILGTITNNSSESYDYVNIEYIVYDKDGNILGNASTGLNKFKKGKSWKFKIVYDGIDAKEIKKYEISNVEAY